jgi:hypothetical protein
MMGFRRQIPHRVITTFISLPSKDLSAGFVEISKKPQRLVISLWVLAKTLGGNLSPTVARKIFYVHNTPFTGVFNYGSVYTTHSKTVIEPEVGMGGLWTDCGQSMDSIAILPETPITSPLVLKIMIML